MSFENSFENQSQNNPSENETSIEKNSDLEKEVEGSKTSKNIFMDALNEELSTLEKSGRISLEQAEEKRNSAALIETGFSDDPKNDALLFSVAGIAGEKELIDIFSKNKSKEKEQESEKRDKNINEVRAGKLEDFLNGQVCFAEDGQIIEYAIDYSQKIKYLPGDEVFYDRDKIDAGVAHIEGFDIDEDSNEILVRFQEKNIPTVIRLQDLLGCNFEKRKNKEKEKNKA